MILYFYLNLGTSCLNTSSIWDEHLLGKKSANWVLWEMALQNKAAAENAAEVGTTWLELLSQLPISLCSQLDCGHQDQWSTSGWSRAHPSGGVMWHSQVLLETLDCLCHLLLLESKACGGQQKQANSHKEVNLRQKSKQNWILGLAFVNHLPKW